MNGALFFDIIFYVGVAAFIVAGIIWVVLKSQPEPLPVTEEEEGIIHRIFARDSTVTLEEAWNPNVRKWFVSFNHPISLPVYMLWKEWVEAAEKEEKERQKEERFRVIVREEVTTALNKGVDSN